MPLLSVYGDVHQYGPLFYWDAGNGPAVYTADGRCIRFALDGSTPFVNIDCCETVEHERTETYSVDGSSFLCQPCIAELDELSDEDSTLAGAIAAPITLREEPLGLSPRFTREQILARRSENRRAEQCARLTPRQRQRWERQCPVPDLEHPDDAPRLGTTDATGPARHRKTAFVAKALAAIDPPQRPFFAEVCPGSGRFSDTIRRHGVEVLEFDLDEGRRLRNLLNASTLHKLEALINDQICIGV